MQAVESLAMGLGSRERPTYSARLLQAFVELLEEYDDFPRFSKRALASGDRVLVETAHQALMAALEFTGDPDLGLKAARHRVVGDLGVFYYVVRSSPTVRHAIAQASRYARLINDALDVNVASDGSKGLLRLQNSVVMP